MCVEFWFGVKLQVKSTEFPERFDTIATCVLSFFSNPIIPCSRNQLILLSLSAALAADERQDRTFRD